MQSSFRHCVAGRAAVLLVKWRFVFKHFIDHIQYAFTVIGACPVFCRCDVGLEELHILLTSFWATIYEPFIHNFEWDQIQSHCKLVCDLFNWHKALEFKV